MVKPKKLVEFDGEFDKMAWDREIEKAMESRLVFRARGILPKREEVGKLTDEEEEA